MGMPAVANDWTVEEVLRLPSDGNRYECVDGELLVSPAPRLSHQAVLEEVYARLREYVRSMRLGRVMLSPADIVLDPQTLVQPDVFVIPRTAHYPREWSDVRDLLLAVEVLSPSTARFDRIVKRRRYQRAGIPEYWIVDTDALLIERWRPADERPEILADRIEWQPVADVEPLLLDIPELFRAALDWSD